MQSSCDNRLCSDDDLRAIAIEHGTPFYLYCVDTIRSRLQALRTAFGGLCEIALSLKANPNPNLLKRLSNDIEWLDVASLGEYWLAQIAGVDAKKMIFAGPGKTAQELDQVIQDSIGLLVAESLQELWLIDAIARRHKKEVNVLLRLNPSFGGHSFGIQMSGVASQFGIDVADLTSAIDITKRSQFIHCRGIHVYLASQVLDAERLYNNFCNVLTLAIKVQRELIQPFTVVDFGGGFGVPYLPHETPLNLSMLGAEVQGLIRSQGSMLSKLGCKFVIESGRFLFAEAGIFVCKILYEKQSRGTRYLVLDGGSNYHGSLAGLGRLLRANFPFYSVSSVAREESEEADAPLCNIVGPLCTPTDVLVRGATVNSHSCGDFVVFEKAGAYGLTFSQERFLSHSSIIELCVEQGRVAAIRRRRSRADLATEYDVTRRD